MYFAVTQFCLGKYLSVVTKEGELYRGALASPPSLLSLSRTPLVQQAQAVYTDYKGANYAVLQNVYAPPQLPQVEASMLTLDLYRLWNSEALFSSVSDVTFVVRNGHYIFYLFSLLRLKAKKC